VSTRDESDRTVRQLLRQRPAQAGRLEAPDRLTDRRRRHANTTGNGLLGNLSAAGWGAYADRVVLLKLCARHSSAVLQPGRPRIRVFTEPLGPRRASHKYSGAVTAINFRIDIFQQHHTPVVRQNLAILRTGSIAGGPI
jgi:hypothetical protein